MTVINALRHWNSVRFILFFLFKGITSDFRRVRDAPSLIPSCVFQLEMWDFNALWLRLAVQFTNKMASEFAPHALRGSLLRPHQHLIQPTEVLFCSRLSRQEVFSLIVSILDLLYNVFTPSFIHFLYLLLVHLGSRDNVFLFNLNHVYSCYVFNCFF